MTKTLDHQLSENDGIGEYKQIIAQQSSAGVGSKRLYLVSIIENTQDTNLFEVEHNKVTIGPYLNLIDAKEAYNNIK